MDGIYVCLVSASEMMLDHLRLVYTSNKEHQEQSLEISAANPLYCWADIVFSRKL